MRRYKLISYLSSLLIVIVVFGFVIYFTHYQNLKNNIWEVAYYNKLLELVDSNEHFGEYVTLGDLDFDGLPEMIIKENSLIPTGEIYTFDKSGEVKEYFAACPYRYELYEKDGEFKWININLYSDSAYENKDRRLYVSELHGKVEYLVIDYHYRSDDDSVDSLLVEYLIGWSHIPSNYLVLGELKSENYHELVRFYKYQNSIDSTN